MKSKSVNSFTGTLFWFFLFPSFAFLLNACSSDNEDIDSPGPGGSGKSSYPVAKAIDLGLPSGTKWASWNIGASAPEEFGGYFAWGETEEKEYYDWSNYSLCDGSSNTCYWIEDIAGTQYDVAHVKWGGTWRIPTLDQIHELLDNCIWDWVDQVGIKGMLITGPNGASIFLPAAGWRDNKAHNVGMRGYYWSSFPSLKPSEGYAATDFTFDSGYKGAGGSDRGFGDPIRAVCR